MKTIISLINNLFLTIILLFSTIVFSQGRPAKPPCKFSEIKGTTFSKNANGTYTPQVEIFNVVYVGNNISKLTSNFKEINFTYDVSGNLISRIEQGLNNGRVIKKSEFRSNSLHQIIEENRYNNGSIIPNRTFKYKYNGKKLIEVTLLDSGKILGLYKYTWSGNNPTRYSANGCTIDLKYKLSKINKFNKDFPLFMFQNIFREFNTDIYYLGENEISNWTNTCAGLAIYTPFKVSYNKNNYPETVKSGTSYQWDFSYNCE